MLLQRPCEGERREKETAAEKPARKAVALILRLRHFDNVTAPTSFVIRWPALLYRDCLRLCKGCTLATLCSFNQMAIWERSAVV